MIRIKKTQLIIKLKDPYPRKLLKDLRMSIVNVIREQNLKTPDAINEELTYSNYKLLELLKSLLKK